MKTRLDAELVRRELARSREQAADLIESRSVLVNGIPATKPATQVDAETSIVLAGKRDDFVSRGGHKLAGALEVFTDVVVEGKVCLDAGASTGGFTDVLLRQGAKKVIAVDVDARKVDALNKRISPIDDTDIEHYLAEKPLQLSATQYGGKAYVDAKYIVVAVPTNYDVDTNSFNTSLIELSSKSYPATKTVLTALSVFVVGFGKFR
jgi:ribosomal protein S4